MGRDVAGLHVGNKPNAINVKPNGTVHVSPKAVPESVETKDSEPKGHATKDDLPEKFVKAGTQKLSDKKSSSPVKPVSGSAINGTNNANSFEPTTPGVEGETSDSGAKCLPMSGDLLSPRTGNSQLNSPFTPRHPLDKKYLDDDDNCSLASSTATSRTSKFQVTVAVGPSFVCADRLERRKEFYSKLEEKHKALEQERVEYEARTRDEEQEAIKQLRKSMTYKANPVPGFYHEGPPPKVELKKLPLTRPKSPNLTRRKSHGDEAKSSPAEKGLRGQATRHSTGVYGEGKGSSFTPKIKDQISARKSNGTSKFKYHPRQLKEVAENPPLKELGSAETAY
ncbi:protein WVD2-like 1 [Primulina huaijiensis]|uniref:protein WVD2-like 1 n=1 Tax=Primulina huaijiensis TaxID=1492673 RepID=UPI003CC73D2A